jgi:hypothetical protein
MVQQLDEILSSAHQIPIVGIDQPPNFDLFIYQPVERGQHAQSKSPGLFSLPLRPATVSFVIPQATYNIRHPPHPDRPQARQETTSDKDIGP